MTRVHSSYSMFARKLMDPDGSCAFEEREIEELRRESKEVKDLLLNSFKEQCDFGLYTLKCHLTGNIDEDVKRFVGLEMLESSPVLNFGGLTNILLSIGEKACQH